MTGFAEFMAEMYKGTESADEKHGAWENTPLRECLSPINDEVDELCNAVCADDIDGPHGVKAESVQVAVTAFKMWRRCDLIPHTG